MQGTAAELFLRAQRLLAEGRMPQACATAAAAQRSAPADPELLDAIGTLFSRANEQRLAAAAYDRAVALAPDNPRFIFNRAAVRRFLGELAAAESDYDRVIALRPNDFEAYKNRAHLRTQTRECNHTAQLEALLGTQIRDWRGEVELRYALAKEYEDLGEYERSFRHLQRGAQLRRRHLQYDVAADVATVDWIMQAFPHVLAAEPALGRATPRGAPIFIVGLPRSGSTLIERIIGSHSSVISAGESHHFALGVVAAARRRTGRPHASREELVASSALVDFAALGQDYLARMHATRASTPETARLIDKMPLNYLYCGLIRRALPQARIIHVRRHPMAAGYAMYKTLFSDGYPFSYDLTEIARHYAGYHRLMSHWEATLPGALLTVRYEELVSDPSGQIRKLLGFCDLEWEDACAQFHLNPEPSTTASAAQVRHRLYDTSVSQWRQYESRLGELREGLQTAGVPIDE
jgi:tetratricopeptide (TPR) repeat protein